MRAISTIAKSRRATAALLLGFVFASAIMGVVIGDEGSCAVSYEDSSPTCGDVKDGVDETQAADSKKKTASTTDSGETTCVTEPDVDYPGDDVNGDVDFSTNVASSTACCELCRVTKHCRFWTFSTPERGRQAHHCWLKNKHVKPYRRTGAHGLVSGYLKSRKDSTATSEQTKKKKEKRDATRQREVKTAKKTREGKTAKDATHTQEEKKEKTAMKNAKKAKELVEQAQVLYHKGMARDAEAVLRRAIAKDGTYGNARMWMGFVLEQLGRWQDAMYAYEAGLAPGRVAHIDNEDLAYIRNNLGLIYYTKQARHADAEAQYRLAIAASEKAGMKQWWNAYKNLARLLEKNGRAKEAMEYLDIAAERLRSDSLRFYSALLLPYVYQDTDDIQAWRKSFKKNLRALAKRGLVISDPFSMEGVPQYYLSYHGRNDAGINEEIARLFRKSCAPCAFRAPHTETWKPPLGSAQALPAASLFTTASLFGSSSQPSAGKKVRVGFVSYYFREHSVSKMALGLVAALDKTSFHTVLYQFGNKDHITEKMAGYMSKLVMLQGTDIASAQRLIADEQLDVLVFAEIGMDPHAYALAFGRHAPIQIAMHGHAQTSGVASIDYYVSYKGFSEPEAQSHYSERLLVVDGHTPLTRYYDLVKYHLSPHMYTEQGRNAFKKRFKIPTGATVYACLQTLFKVDPRMDHVTKRILEGDAKAVVLFKELPMTDQVGKLAIDRMRKTLSEEEMQRVVFMPPVAEQDYRDAYLVVDVLIDSFPFGGHTTSMDAFSAGCPVVTMPTDLMSGRCTQGFLSFMGLGELIVADVDSLVQVSLKVGRDKAYRDKLSRTIIESLPALTRDETSVREWASLLLAAATAGHKALEKWHSTSGVRKYTGG